MEPQTPEVEEISLLTDINVFADTDEVHLDPDESVTRVGIEGELRSYTVSVQQVKDNNYICKITFTAY